MTSLITLRHASRHAVHVGANASYKLYVHTLPGLIGKPLITSFRLRALILQFGRESVMTKASHLVDGLDVSCLQTIDDPIPRSHIQAFRSCYVELSACYL